MIAIKDTMTHALGSQNYNVTLRELDKALWQWKGGK